MPHVNIGSDQFEWVQEKTDARFEFQFETISDMMALKARSHNALWLDYGQTRQKVVSREADDVVRVDVEFKTSYSRFIDVAGRGEKSERRLTQQKVLNCSKF